jgi:hypothetical protein
MKGTAQAGEMGVQPQRFSESRMRPIHLRTRYSESVVAVPHADLTPRT